MCIWTGGLLSLYIVSLELPLNVNKSLTKDIHFIFCPHPIPICYLVLFECFYIADCLRPYFGQHIWCTFFFFFYAWPPHSDKVLRRTKDRGETDQKDTSVWMKYQDDHGFLSMDYWLMVYVSVKERLTKRTPMSESDIGLIVVFFLRITDF